MKTNLKIVDTKQNALAAVNKLYKSDTVEKCLADENDDGEFWNLWHDMKLIIELPDGSKWGPLFSGASSRGALFRPYHLPYVDIYNHHMNRRHRSQWITDHADLFFVVRADRAEPTKMFCESCGWLNPVQDPEILESTDTKNNLAKSSNATKS